MDSVAKPPRNPRLGSLGLKHAAAAAVLAALGLLGRCAGDGPVETPILLVTLGGEARALEPLAGVLDLPVLAFPTAHSPANWPAAGVRSLLGPVEATSRPSRGWSPEALEDSVLTLAERLRAAGLRPAAVLADARVAAVEGLQQGFDSFDVGPAAVAEGLESTQAALATAREALRSSSFVWVHLRGAQPAYGVASAADGRGDEARSRDLEQWLRASRKDPAAARDDLVRCHGEAQAAHRAALAAFLRELTVEGPAAPRVLVTALCGFELLEGGLIGEGTSALEAGLAVPFLLLGPGLPEGSVRRRVSLQDVGPTVLDLAGLGGPDDCGGLSVLPGSPAPWRLHVATVRRLRHADVLYEEDLKLLRDRETGALALYDLAADPGETQDLSKRRGSELSRLKVALDQRVEAP